MGDGESGAQGARSPADTGAAKAQDGLDAVAPEPARILVVDDEAALRDSLARSLEAVGYAVVTAADGAAGIAEIRRQRPNLVLVDLRMPVLDGFEVLRAAHGIDAELPVIIFTGADDRELLLQALRRGAFDYLQKPLLTEELLRAVKRGLRQDLLARESRAVRARLEAVNRQLEDHLSALELDQRAGRRVQLGMLPPSPMAVGPYRLQHRIFPSQLLSGDFVDYFELTPQVFAFYVADVAGHGASSAFVTVLLKNCSRRLRREYRPAWLQEPGAILDWLNRELLEMDLDKHVALFLGLVERDGHVLHWANAGHFPPPLLATQAGVQVLEMRSPPLGLFPDQAYASETMELPPPFSLIACTDGILELFQDMALEEKEQRLQAALTPATKDVSAYLEALSIAEPSAAPDDVALLLLTCRTASGRPDSRH